MAMYQLKESQVREEQEARALASKRPHHLYDRFAQGIVSLDKLAVPTFLPPVFPAKDSGSRVGGGWAPVGARRGITPKSVGDRDSPSSPITPLATPAPSDHRSPRPAAPHRATRLLRTPHPYGRCRCAAAAHCWPPTPA